MAWSGLFLKGRAISAGLDIFHQRKEIFLADMCLFGVGKEAFQRFGNQTGAGAGVLVPGGVETSVLLFGASEGDGFHVHGVNSLECKLMVDEQR